MADSKKKENKSGKFQKDNIDFETGRMIQLESLMKWKKEGMNKIDNLNLNEENSFKKIFLEKVNENNLCDFVAGNIQALLINPVNKNQNNSEFELENLVKIYKKFIKIYKKFCILNLIFLFKFIFFHLFFEHILICFFLNF